MSHIATSCLPRIKRTATTLSWALALLLLISPLSSAQARDYYLKAEGDQAIFAMTTDLLIARPVLLVSTLAGTALFTLALPVTALSGSIDEAAETLVRRPASATFMRCLGCIEVPDQQR
ncbi:hypothetical protein V6U78_06025 [Marinospirillum sp. MEB164]|uniref:Multidrug transporter n=1 Tax=Marinospirillum alkalitolerans TaxID=3123374 RepID=A0ABW8PWB3_9GAMM